jgi:hypothetical protein
MKETAIGMIRICRCVQVQEAHLDIVEDDQRPRYDIFSKTYICTHLPSPVDSRNRTIICTMSWNGRRSCLQID